MRLLIVENDEDTAGFMRYVLEEERHSVRTASAVGAARWQLRDYKPDLIILDRGLPDSDGVDFCRELKSRPGFLGVPVLFVSAARSPAQIHEAFAAGGDDYIVKPFSVAEFLARIESVLRRPARLSEGPDRLPQPS